MGYIALYRRFRPEKFSEIAGQHAVVETLKNQVGSGHISHAYLFCGPRGVGKTTAARIFARAINCSSPEDGEACGKCPGCQSFAAQDSMDIIEIDAASNNGVDNIRDLRENTRFMPATGKYRVYIIDEVHMLSKQAFNALLKTLEEPPKHIVFIMATTEPHKLPVTVLSRCQRYDFKRLTATEIVNYLKGICAEAGINADDRALSYMARAATGGMRDAISLLDQCAALGKEQIEPKDVSAMLGAADASLYFALADAILQGDLKRALTGIDHMMKTGCDPARVAADMLEHFRDLFVSMYVADPGHALAVDDATAARFKSQGAKASSSALIRFLDIFSHLEGDLRFAASPRTWLELSVGKCCITESPNSYDALLERVEKIEKALKDGARPAQKRAVNSREPEHEPEFFPVNDDDIRDYPQEPSYEDAPVEEYNMPPEPGIPYEELAEPPKPEPEPEIKRQEQPKQQEQAEQPKEHAPAAGKGDAKKLWQQAGSMMQKNKQMRAVMAMKKGRAVSLEDGRLHVLFPPDAVTAMTLLKTEAVKQKLTAALVELAGGNIVISLGEEKLNDEEQKIVDVLSGDFPNLNIEIEYDDD